MSNIAGGTTLTTSLVQTGDTTGNLVFQTNGNTTALTLNTAQNATFANAVTVTGNVTGGNLLSSGLISVAGAITTGGDHSLVGNIVDTGNLWINTTANGNITLNPTGTGQTFITTGLSLAGNITSRAILETTTVTAAAPTATTNFDMITQAIVYYSANANANFTLNFRGSSAVTANTLLAIGQSTTTALLVTNGATPYYPNLIQVDSANVTPKWQGGTAITSGNANAIDVYAFTLIKTAANTYTVLGSQTKFS
jgi:hypothetical protein